LNETVVESRYGWSFIHQNSCVGFPSSLPTKQLTEKPHPQTYKHTMQVPKWSFVRAILQACVLAVPGDSHSIMDTDIKNAWMCDWLNGCKLRFVKDVSPSLFSCCQLLIVGSMGTVPSRLLAQVSAKCTWKLEFTSLYEYPKERKFSLPLPHANQQIGGRSDR
jgi:hypothetical protein